MTKQISLNVHDIYNDLTAGYDLCRQIGIRITDCHVVVKSNSSALIATLNNYFDGIVETSHGEVSPDISIVAIDDTTNYFDDIEFTVNQPDAGKTKIKEEVMHLSDGKVIRKRLTGMIFIIGNGYNCAVGNCVENYNQIVNFINNRYIEWMLNRGALLFHASGVSLNGKGMMIAGFSGMGKSTLALHLVSAGCSMVSNDRVLVKNTPDGLMMYGVPKLPRVNPGTILNNEHLIEMLEPEERDFYHGLPQEKLWHIEKKYDVPIPQMFGEKRFKLAHRLEALVVLNWHLGEKPIHTHRVRIGERNDLCPAFMKSPGLFFMPHDDSDSPDFTNEAYMECLKECEVYEVFGGVDFTRATYHCLDLLDIAVAM